MKKKLVHSQIGNYKTYLMYKRQCLTLAENVFEFKNLPNFIDTAYLNKILLREGAIVFFKDEVMGLVALPFNVLGTLDVYGRPNNLIAYSKNGYRRRLSKDEFVIMYDNNGRYPLILDILQYAERLSLATRTIDINMSQQRTPRFWKCKTENERTVRDIINNVDANPDTVLTYKDIDLDDIQIVLEPAPYVADKLNLDKEKIWNEFLRLIGIANTNFQKKERNIKDEVLASQGGTIASRFSRFEPRKKAIDEINEKFSDILENPIEVNYYDGIPASNETDEDLEGDDIDYDI